MLKINLLPGYIVERRRVKALAIFLGFILVLVVVGFMAYLWAPAPFSLAAKYAKVIKERDKAYAEQAAVEKIQADTAALRNSYQTKETRVSWVDRVDKRPTAYVAYFKSIARYFPADVVINGLPLPSGSTLNLTGSTNSLMSATRWYLNMLRCEMVAPSQYAVNFTPGQLAAGSANPRMAMPVSVSVQLRPEEVDFMMPEAPPAGMGGAAGRGGGRMGGGRGGGGRGGGGMGGRGGGRGGRGGGGRGGPRGGGMGGRGGG